MCFLCLKALKPKTSDLTPCNIVEDQVEVKIDEDLPSDPNHVERKHTDNENTSSSSNPRDDRKMKICNLYKKSSCPHGLRGSKTVDGKVCQCILTLKFARNTYHLAREERKAATSNLTAPYSIQYYADTRLKVDYVQMYVYPSQRN